MPGPNELRRASQDARRDHGRQAAGKKAALQRVVSAIDDSCRKQQS